MIERSHRPDHSLLILVTDSTHGTTQGGWFCRVLVAPAGACSGECFALVEAKNETSNRERISAFDLDLAVDLDLAFDLAFPAKQAHTLVECFSGLKRLCFALALFLSLTF